jgi:hypothetical protein
VHLHCGIEISHEKGHNEGSYGNWESPLDHDEEKESRTLLKDMDKLRRVKFPKSITPREGQYKIPYLWSLEMDQGKTTARWNTSIREKRLSCGV